MSEIKRINSRKDLIELAAQLGVRPNWHEPDEREVDVEVKGASFDNAGTWGPDFDARHPDGSGDSYREISVVIRQEGAPVAEVNLADLFAWASRPEN